MSGFQLSGRTTPPVKGLYGKITECDGIAAFGNSSIAPFVRFPIFGF
jgi:hypothetical protein